MTFKEFYDKYEGAEDFFDGYYIDIRDDDKNDIEVDCADVKPNICIELTANRLNKRITFYNCYSLDIRTVIGESSYSDIIVIQGNENRILGFNKSSFRINGNNNTASIISNSYIGIIGNNNIVNADGSSFCNCEEGENNSITLLFSAQGYIHEKCENTCIVLKDESRVKNFSPSSSIICFGNSMCHTVSCERAEAFKNSAVINLSGKCGKSQCREPIDEDSGYFYKVVSHELHPLFYTDDPDITYAPGTFVYPKGFTGGYGMTCAEGIHFFATIAETLNFLFDRWNFEKGYYDGYEVVRLKVNFKDIASMRSDGSESKMRARVVYVDSIVPREEYREYFKFYPQRISKIDINN